MNCAIQSLCILKSTFRPMLERYEKNRNSICDDEGKAGEVWVTKELLETMRDINRR